jgi:hypothetical protein
MCLANSGIAGTPLPEDVSSTGWVSLGWTALSDNLERFDMSCEYRVTTEHDTVFAPIAMHPETLTFKQSSLTRLARVDYNLKNTFMPCKDGNMSNIQREDASRVIIYYYILVYH